MLQYPMWPFLPIFRGYKHSQHAKMSRIQRSWGPCGFEFVPHILPDPQSIQGPDAETLAWPGRLGHQRPSPGFSKSCECLPWRPTWPFGNLGEQAGCPWMAGSLVLFTMFTTAWKRSAWLIGCRCWVHGLAARLCVTVPSSPGVKPITHVVYLRTAKYQFVLFPKKSTNLFFWKEKHTVHHLEKIETSHWLLRNNSLRR